MGLFDPSLAGDATGGFLSKPARQSRTPADTVAQRFPASEPSWLGPASLLGIGTSLPLFPPLQPDAAPQWSPPPGGDLAPATDTSTNQSALPFASSGATGPWTAFQQNDVPSVAPGATTGPWTAFQPQPSASAAATDDPVTQQADAVVASPANGHPLIDEGGKNWVSQAGVFAPQPSDQQLADRLSAYLADNPTPPQPSLFDRVADRFNNPPNKPSLIGLAGQF